MALATTKTITSTKCEHCKKPTTPLYDNNYCKKCCDIIDKQSIPKTMKEWCKNQTSKPPISYYSVHSESTVGVIYEIACFKDTYVCTCPAWKMCYYNINKPYKQRTCKHIIAVRGEENERKRITEWSYKPAKVKSKINI